MANNMSLAEQQVTKAIELVHAQHRRGPSIAFIINRTTDTGSYHQGMIDDWSIDLKSESDIKKFGEIVNAIYNIKEWV